MPDLESLAHSSATVLGTELVLAWPVNPGVVIYLRRCKPTIVITPGRWAEVVEHGEMYKCPPWEARLVVTRPDHLPADDQVGPIYPYIEVKYGNRLPTVHSSRAYEADELDVWARGCP